jgi:NAD-dependent dihydropyrimidine dehydrogenase PreA subunit
LILGWLGKAKAVDITRKPEAECLTGCGLCLTTCRFGVAPRDQLDTDQCMLCNACVASCPADVLTIAAVRPARKRWKLRAAVAVAVIVLGAVAAPTAFAHHVKGMPHYGYLENYPQTPTREWRLAAPPYGIVVVVYGLEGLDRARSQTPDDGLIYVSLTETASGKAYRGRLEVTLRLIGGGKTISRKFKAPLEEKVYRMRATLAADAYELTVRIPGEPDIVAVARLALGGGTDWWLVAIGAAVGIRRRPTVSRRGAPA